MRGGLPNLRWTGFNVRIVKNTRAAVNIGLLKGPLNSGLRVPFWKILRNPYKPLYTPSFHVIFPLLV